MSTTPPYALPEKGVLNDVLSDLVRPPRTLRPSRILVVACGVKIHFPWDKACRRYDAANSEVCSATADLPVEIVRADEPFEDPDALCELLDRS